MTEKAPKVLTKVVPREQWSKLGFILAGIGSAVGLGNIWRFPYIAGQNGGGGFLLAYLISVLFLAFPLLLLEFAAGWKFQTSILSFFKKIGARTRYLSWFFIFGGMAILSYYVVIVGWVFAYFIFSFTGYGTFAQFSGSYLPLVFFLICIIILFSVDSFGIKKGVEKMCMWIMPVMFVILVVLLIRALSLPNAMAGVSFFLRPDFTHFLDPRMWIFAFSQAFFSIGVGYGLLLTYASYADRMTDIPLSAISISVTDTIVSVLAGLIVFSLVFSFGLNPGEGPELAFVTLPKIFALIPFGRVFGAVFFLMLLLAGLTSAISIGEMGVSSLIDEFGMTRKKANTIIYGIALAAGLPSALSYSAFKLSLFGKPFLDHVDFFASSILLPVAVLIFTIVVSWFWSSKAFIEAVNKHTKINMPHWIIYIIRYLIPFAIFLVLMIGVMT
ncbi:MAG: sodium-dependent transporter [archaeon]